MPSTATYDIVVFAATPGGVTAAVAAAREGRAVALLEAGSYVGGAMSGGLGMADYGMNARRVMGGLSAEFFERVARKYGVPFEWPPDGQCGQHNVPWVSEPHVAEQVFLDMLRDANVTLLHQARVTAIQATRVGAAPLSPLRIASVVTADGRAFSAAVFIDASYEGTLMKLAGASYTFGREANSTYNESTAGRLPGPSVTDWPQGVRAAQLPRGISPFVDATNTSLLPGVWGGAVAPVGGADERVGAYDWRLTLTDDPNNSVPIPRPKHYDPAEFELVRRALRAGMEHVAKFPSFHIPNRKTDWKAFGLFGEHPNYQWAYPDAPWARQQQVVAEYRRYIVSLLHFFRTDPAVPASLRAQYATLGLPLDEYNRSAHWTPQLYVRSALRLIGERVLTQHDVVVKTWRRAADGVGLGDYTVDVPGPVQIIIDRGEVVSEGALKVPSFCDPKAAPFALPYAIMVPKRSELDNLLVPVAVSASHVAFNAVRLEPTWMILGMSAGVAAAMAVTAGGGLGPGGVGNVDVGALRSRLHELGQRLEPLPT